MIARRFSNVGRFVRNAAGSTAVEFAFVLPIMVLMFLGIIEGGRTYLAVHALEKIAGDGVRYASVRGSESQSPTTQTQVTDFMKSRAAGLVVAELAVTLVWPDGNNDPGSRVTVQVTYDHEPLFGNFVGWQEAFHFERASDLKHHALMARGRARTAYPKPV